MLQTKVLQEFKADMAVGRGSTQAGWFVESRVLFWEDGSSVEFCRLVCMLTSLYRVTGPWGLAAQARQKGSGKGWFKPSLKGRCEGGE